MYATCGPMAPAGDMVDKVHLALSLHHWLGWSHNPLPARDDFSSSGWSALPTRRLGHFRQVSRGYDVVVSCPRSPLIWAKEGEVP